MSENPLAPLIPVAYELFKTLPKVTAQNIGAISEQNRQEALERLADEFGDFTLRIYTRIYQNKKSGA